MFRVFRASSLGFRIFLSRVWGFKFRVEGFKFRVFKVLNLGFRVWGLRVFTVRFHC